MEQIIIHYADSQYRELDAQLERAGIRHLMLVCGRSAEKLRIYEYLCALPERLHICVTRFSDFAPNPQYESAAEGVRIFREAGCDGILAVGGGSAIDVAKCIKLFAAMPQGAFYLDGPFADNDIPLFAMPTTAGTGSEATRFAVVYYQGNKQSVTHDSMLPSVVLFDPSALEMLPDYQRKVTMLDALCHAVESCWSVNADESSRTISADAIRMILDGKDAYLANTPEGNRTMLLAAYTAGRAINLTQTTAGHAMCYKLTSLYGIAHGHAAALCVKALWPYMLEHTGDCIDSRGEDYLKQTLAFLADAFGCCTGGQAAETFTAFVDSLALDPVGPAGEEEIALLSSQVNPDRLKNHPVRLTRETIEVLYRTILGA